MVAAARSPHSQAWKELFLAPATVKRFPRKHMDVSYNRGPLKWFQAERALLNSSLCGRTNPPGG